MSLERKKFTTQIGGKELTIEKSRLAEQANASVLASYGETAVLATAVMEDKDSDADYMPLTVNYEEKFYAAGKILGSRFMRREGRAPDGAILTSRLIDRALRPLFDKRIRRPIQIIATILSYDEENSPDFVAMMAASTALAISDIPWDGPVSGISVSVIDGKTVVNPTKSDLDGGKEVDLESFFAGTSDNINMVELSGNQSSEESVLEAAKEAQKAIKDLVSFQKDIVEKIGKPKTELDLKEPSPEFLNEAKSFLDSKLQEAIYVEQKTERSGKLSDLKDALHDHLESKEFSEEELEDIEDVFEKEIDDLIHKNILEKGKRPDGRALDEVRELYTETGLLPRAHGSALFFRGNTQALAVTTLGAPGDAQLVDTIEFSGNKRFMLHYNFPPYSVGEVRPIRGPGRREIGHGALAEKAILPLLPTVDEFPYTIRVVSEILSSNGSSSMATTTATSVSLMDAGVPLRAPAAGIAVGLIAGPEGTYKLLTDIQGPEDYYGDMDFKVAGTRNGVTAIQMDVKINGITREIMKDALGAAKKARLHILDNTDAVISKGREELSPLAPRILSLQIDPERIGEVIGPGGKVINGIIEKTGAESIDIEDDGKVFITAKNAAAAEAAVREVQDIVKDLQVGEIVEGEVAKILEFGAIVELGGGKSGLLHVSELKDDFVKDVNSVVKVGDKVKVKVIKIENGKTSLSLKQAEQ